MDTKLLVEQKIDDGQKLVDHLVRAGFPVAVALWARTEEEGPVHLYIASSAVDGEKVGEAYQVVYRAWRQLASSWVDFSAIKLIPANSPVANAAVELRARYPSKSPTRAPGNRLGDLAVEEVYIYPPPKSMEVIVRGKEEVLRYLETDSQARAGKPGEYLLARDERGDLVAFIAGHSFVGGGTLRLGGRNLQVVDGIVVEVPPE